MKNKHSKFHPLFKSGLYSQQTWKRDQKYECGGVSPLKWTALMSIRSRLGGKADRKSVIFPFVAFFTQSFICCRLSKTAGSESYNRWDSLTKSCFGSNPETHHGHTLSDSVSLKPALKVSTNRQTIGKLLCLQAGAVCLNFKHRQLRKKLCFLDSNLRAWRYVWQSAGRCLWAALRHYAETRGSRGECFHGGDASAAPVSHLLHL